MLILLRKWCPRTDSNRGPIDYKSIALPAELQGHRKFKPYKSKEKKITVFFFDKYDKKKTINEVM